MSLILKFFPPKHIYLMANGEIENKIIRDNNSKNSRIPNISKIRNGFNIKMKKIQIIIFFIYILRIVFSKQLYLKYSEITLKVSGSGEFPIFNQGEPNRCPDYIYLNEDQENNMLNTDNCCLINLASGEISTIKLIWNSTLSNLLSMFFRITNIIEADLSKFDASEVENMRNMFFGCHSIKSINFKNFNTSKVKSLECTFYECFSLTELDLSSFDTSNIIEMRLLFFDCRSLTSVNIESFDTSQVLNMEYLFFRCNSLKNITLRNFDTSKVQKMNYMFCECNSLVSLDLSMFNTSSLTEMDSIFAGSSLLTSLELSNFDTSKVKTMKSVFEGCQSLNYLDISRFYTYEVNNMDSLFKNCKNLLSLNLSSFDTSNVVNMGSMFEGCSSLTSLNLNSFIINKDTILKNMFKDCINLEYINFEFYIEPNDTESINNILLNTPDNIVICINENNTENIMYIISQKNLSVVYCGEDWKSKQKYIQGKFIYLSSEINIISTDIYNNYNNFLDSTSFSIKIKDDNLTSHEKNNKIYENITKNILQNYKGLNGEEIIIEGKDDYVFRLSTTENMFQEKNNNTIKLSKIDLGTCEDALRQNNNLNENITLIILSMEKQTNISSERNIQFEVYESINKTRLNLSICKNIPIDIYIPLVISDELNNLYNELKDLGYNLFDINDKFYQDICTPYKSSNKTDVLLSDRINDYFNNDETQCQSGCKYSTYSIETQNIKCECNIEKSEIKIGQDEGSKSIYKSFYEILKYSNYKVLKCYKLALRLINFKSNLGCIIIFVLFLLSLIFLIIYIFKGIDDLKINIPKPKDLIIENKQKDITNTPMVVFKEHKKIIPRNKSIAEFKRQSSQNLNYGKNSIFNKNSNKYSSKSVNRRSIKPKINIFSNPLKKSSRKNINFQNNNDMELNKNKKRNSQNNKSKKVSINTPKEINNKRKKSSDLFINEKENKLEKLDNFELNNLEYNLALKYDKRSFSEIYLSIIKREHLIIFTFFLRNDHNLVYIKVSRLIFLICKDMVLNVFFFSDETMHKMYLDYGKYNFVQQIPQIIYSTIVSNLIEVFLCYLSLTDKHYYEMKKINNNNSHMILKIFECIKIKIAFFYIFIFLMFIFSWYTVTCFCAVYENTQIAFIKDSFLSFGLGLLYPFVLYLIPSFLRIISLKYCNGKLSFIYKLSDIIPIF